MSTPFAIAAQRIGRISRTGSVAGLFCGAVVYAAFYLGGIVVLGMALVLTLAASKYGALRGPTPRLDDRRGAANILANCGVGTLAAVAELSHMGLATEATALWLVTAIAAGASDTVASEIGQAYGGQPRSFPTGRAVAPGTPGAVTIAGTLAGVLSAAMIAVPAAAMWLIPWGSLLTVVVAATIGAFSESLLATAFDRGGRAANHLLNLLNTTVASAVAVLWH